MKCILTIVMLLTSTSVHAALNKWIDADGKVHYSDSAPSDAKVKQIRSSSATEATPESALPGSEAPAQKTIAEREADWKKSQLSKAEDEKKAANKKEEASIKQKNCEGSRSNLAGLENSSRLVTYNSSGERSYLDEASRAQRIDEARKAVTSYCN